MSRRTRLGNQVLLLLAAGALLITVATVNPQSLDDSCSSVGFDNLNATGLLLTTLLGGTAGTCAIDMAVNPTPDYPASSNSFVKTITVWTSASAVVGIRLTLFNGLQFQHGCIACDASNGRNDSSYTLDRGETLQSLSLWDDADADADAGCNSSPCSCGGLSFTTSSGGSFTALASGLTRPRENRQRVGSGIIAGLFGRYGDAVVNALGFAFVPALAEPYYIAGVKLVPRAGSECDVDRQLAAPPTYVVSQLCEAAAAAGSGGSSSGSSLACESTAVQTWTSQQSLFVTQSLGLPQSVEARGNVSCAAFASGAAVSALVGNATFTANGVATISRVAVGLTGLVTIQRGQALVLSSTVRLVRLRAVYWTGRITFRTTSGPVLYVAVDGTYDLTLVVSACSETATRGSSASRCRCGGSCGQQVSQDVFPTVVPANVVGTVFDAGLSPVTRGSAPPYLLGPLPVARTDTSALGPIALSAAKVLGSSSGSSRKAAASISEPEARWIWAPASTTTSQTAAVTATFVKQLTVAADMPAFLYISVNDTAEVFVNGQLIGAVAGNFISWSQGMMAFRQPTRVQLRKGVNTLALRCRGGSGGSGGSSSSVKPGLQVSILDNGSNSGSGKRLAVTDASWKVYTGESSPPYVSGASVLGPVGVAPWGTPDEFPDPGAQWIWSDPAAATWPASRPADSADAPLPVFFRTYVSSSSYDTSADLYVVINGTADVFLNGQLVATVSGGWQPGESRPAVAVSLVSGANLLAVRCRSYGGPAGLLVSMAAYEDYDAEQQTTLLHSDASWSVIMQALPGASVLGPAPSALPDPLAASFWSQPWAERGASPDLVPTFWKTVTVSKTTQARLRLVSGAGVDVSLNGVHLASVTGNSVAAAGTAGVPALEVDVALVAGRNTVALRARGPDADGAPAGLAASLVVVVVDSEEADSGAAVLARTDGSWRYSLEGPAMTDCSPSGWCNGAGEQLRPVDCDADGLQDWVCMAVGTGNGIGTSSGGSGTGAGGSGSTPRSVRISSLGCAGGSWSQVPVASCPAAFK